MKEKYDLNEILKEIEKDEKDSVKKSVKLSQKEILELIKKGKENKVDK